MRVSFKGKARLRGSSSGGRLSRRARREIRRTIRSELRRGLRRMGRDLRASFRRDLRRELYSDRFADFLRGVLVPDPNARWREIAQGLLNEPVQVETSAGGISGVITEVGEDYMILRETPGTILVVPFQNVTSIQPL